MFSNKIRGSQTRFGQKVPEKKKSRWRTIGTLFVGFVTVYFLIIDASVLRVFAP